MRINACTLTSRADTDSSPHAMKVGPSASARAITIRCLFVLRKTQRGYRLKCSGLKSTLCSISIAHSFSHFSIFMQTMRIHRFNDGFANGHARIERRIKVLEDNLYILTKRFELIFFNSGNILSIVPDTSAGRIDKAPANCGPAWIFPQPDSPHSPSVSPFRTVKLISFFTTFTYSSVFSKNVLRAGTRPQLQRRGQLRARQPRRQRGHAADADLPLRPPLERARRLRQPLRPRTPVVPDLRRNRGRFVHGERRRRAQRHRRRCERERQLLRQPRRARADPFRHLRTRPRCLDRPAHLAALRHPRWRWPTGR